MLDLTTLHLTTLHYTRPQFPSFELRVTILIFILILSWLLDYSTLFYSTLLVWLSCLLNNPCCFSDSYHTILYHTMHITASSLSSLAYTNIHTLSLIYPRVSIATNGSVWCPVQSMSWALQLCALCWCRVENNILVFSVSSMGYDMIWWDGMDGDAHGIYGMVVVFICFCDWLNDPCDLNICSCMQGW
jgi:hypothetical protein